ncbi:MAG TPA: TonB-dependent receptor plug domain-containing protein [Bacteroidia bacterium]|nr:TonB-dependent receptor plug domain-containing protein [Bacteroidia bacterium]
MKDIVFSQNLSDTLHLQSVDIVTTSFHLKDSVFSAGKKIQQYDSLSKVVFSANALSDILNYQSGVYVKNYAPGSISSTSIRGGNAQQTMLLWNGVNINHPMLGQSDVALSTVGLFENISVEYGASSSLWGSGSVNGAIRLENKFSNKNSAELIYRYGQFQTHQILSKVFLSHKNLQIQLKPYFIQSENNYKIGDSLILKNANYSLQGIMNGVSYSFKNNHLIRYYGWYNEGNRNIPNNYFFNKYSSQQKDKSFRNIVEYNFSKAFWKANIKISYLNDVLNYKDSVARIFSNSNVYTFQSEENIFRQIGKNAELVLGHLYVRNIAITNNYDGIKNLIRNSVYAGWSQTLSSFRYNIIVRKEWANIRSDIPFTGNLGVEWRLHPLLSFKLQSSLFYRLPTLNDLYWKGSGKDSLKPESGYHYEGGIVFHYKISSVGLTLHSEATAFNKITNNWIIWLPGGNNQPVPANIFKVWSRGTETDNYIEKTFQQAKIKLGLHSAYVLSTIQESLLPNDASIGKQLIYTPRYNINGYLQSLYKRFFMMMSYQYTGYRFISSDNLQWLEPYFVMNISGGYSFLIKKFKIQIMAGINNLTNTSYQIVAQRPMPGRNYFIQFSIKY